MIIPCFASSANPEFFFSEEDVTIVFSEDSELSYEKQQFIADKLVNGYVEPEVSTYSWCWLTGHDKVSESVSVITHKLNDKNPRCMRETYEVTTCTKCDYYNQDLVSTIYIFCCPEN